MNQTKLNFIKSSQYSACLSLFFNYCSLFNICMNEGIALSFMGFVLHCGSIYFLLLRVLVRLCGNRNLKQSSFIILLQNFFDSFSLRSSRSLRSSSRNLSLYESWFGPSMRSVSHLCLDSLNFVFVILCQCIRPKLCCKLKRLPNKEFVHFN